MYPYISRPRPKVRTVRGRDRGRLEIQMGGFIRLISEGSLLKRDHDLCSRKATIVLVFHGRTRRSVSLRFSYDEWFLSGRIVDC